MIEFVRFLSAPLSMFTPSFSVMFRRLSRISRLIRSFMVSFIDNSRDCVFDWCFVKLASSDRLGNECRRHESRLR